MLCSLVAKKRKVVSVRATAVHPGGIQTELARHMAPEVIQGMIGQINAQAEAEGVATFEWKTVPQGAATSVWAGVVAPASLVGGLYCEDCHVAELADDGSTLRAGVRSYALDLDHAEALWALSERMVGETF